jgi:ABC-type antimicrobial peptide transport system permease subunit
VLVLRQAAAITLAGAAAGLAVSLACGRFLQGLLFGVAPADPASHAAAMAILAAVVLAACDAPARRAARIAPAESLKSE